MTAKLHLVLDIDGTAVVEPTDVQKKDGDYMKAFSPQARPYLAEFLQAAFHTFDTVSIWTSANRSWFQHVNNEVISHFMPRDSSWYRTITFTDYYLAVTQLQIDPRKVNFNLKPLQVMWEGDSLMTQHNTLVIDNNPITYSLNPENALPIQTYDTQRQEKGDIELMKLTFYFQRLESYFQEHGTVTTLDKTLWSQEVSDQLQLGQVFD